MPFKKRNRNSGQKTAIALLSATSTFASFSQFEPSVFTIRNLVTNPNDVRIGYIPSLFISGMIAWAASSIIKSSLPLKVWLGASATTIGVYELAMRK